MTIANVFKCETCGGERFVPGRKIRLVAEEGGVIGRAWQSSPDDANAITCQQDGTRYRWNYQTQKYERV
jgi:hypothetical protein